MLHNGGPGHGSRTKEKSGRHLLQRGSFDTYTAECRVYLHWDIKDRSDTAWKCGHTKISNMGIKIMSDKGLMLDSTSFGRP